jgi:Kef-type K+ transport system membrane component KefB
VLSARLTGLLLARLGQPVVIGEILAGILLGPTLLGHLTGHHLFPATVLPSLTTLADMGLVLFMFVIGLEVDQTLVRSKGRAAGWIATGATVLPFALGCALALLLADQHAHGRRPAFVLFVGTAVCATAFPVLARILTDRNMQRTAVGGLALSVAAVIDVVAWTLLATVVAIVKVSDRSSWHLFFIPAYLLVMLVAVRPLLRRLAAAVEHAGRLSATALSCVLIGLLLSAWATQWMQIHFIFGAFLLGILMPRSGTLIPQVLERIQQLATLLLLPIFFVVTGLTVDLSALPLGGIGILVAILAVSVGGKLIGGYAGARFAGLPHHESAVLATLLNTRGLTEIVILSVGLQERLLDPELYSLMIVMALVTTAMTGPLLSWFGSRTRVAGTVADADRTAVGAAR